MLKGTINFTGKTFTDVELAIKEALKKIEAGFTSGLDSNDDGDFNFHISGDEEGPEDDQ